MNIGEVIRNHRKKMHMTQEEMAGRLGVSAPAVNKWENGVSYPDIMLLAPIARLLGITVDILLSFHESLTEDEISRMVQELDVMLKEGSYEEAFQWAKERLVLYPNCELLFWQFALILDTQRLVKEIEDATKYDDMIRQWYTRALESEDEDIRFRAADSLFGFYERKEQYEKAEEYLIFFSEQNPNKKRKQADIYGKTGRRTEAYKAYEELLFSGYQEAAMIFHSLYMMALEEKKLDQAHLLVEKEGELARVFDMGEYHGISGKLELAVIEKDAETAVDIMEKMLSSVEEMCGFVKSPLYGHMEFKEISEEFLEKMKQNLLTCFRDEETYGFLKGNKRWQGLVN